MKENTEYHALSLRNQTHIHLGSTYRPYWDVPKLNLLILAQLFREEEVCLEWQLQNAFSPIVITLSSSFTMYFKDAF